MSGAPIAIPAVVDEMTQGLRDLISQCGTGNFPKAIWPQDKSWIIAADRSFFDVVAEVLLTNPFGLGLEPTLEIHLYHPDTDVMNALPAHLKAAGYESARLVDTTHITASRLVYDIRAVKVLIARTKA